MLITYKFNENGWIEIYDKQGKHQGSYSTLTDGTKQRWTIDIPMEFVGKNGKKIFMKLNLNRKFLWNNQKFHISKKL